MDPNLLEQGAAIDMGFVRGVITALTLVVFLGICAWAYHGRNRARFDEDALLPFEDDERAAQAARARGAGERVR